MSGELIRPPEFEVRACDACGAEAVRRTMRERTFAYGVGDQAVDLRATAPVWTCAACGDAYAESDAEDIEHEAVCAHLGVLSPREVRDLRDRLKLTQAALAALTGHGEASIKRWEAGALVQNRSADTLLRVAASRQGLALLREIASDREVGAERRQLWDAAPEPIRREAAVFQLRRAAG